MSSERRCKELREQREREDEERALEEHRYANLSMYERIEECEDVHDIKRLLHEITEALNL